MGRAARGPATAVAFKQIHTGVALSVEDAFKVIMSAGLVTPEADSNQASLPGLEAPQSEP